MNKTVRIILSLIVGGLCGAFGGALSLGLPTYFSRGSGFMGPTSGWAGVMAGFGFVYGIIPGIVIGLLAVLLKANKAVGALIGASVGISILCILFLFGLDPNLDPLYSIAGAL